MRTPHEKQGFSMTKRGILLLFMQYRFYRSVGLALQVPYFQAQTYLQCISGKKGGKRSGNCWMFLNDKETRDQCCTEKAGEVVGGRYLELFKVFYME